MPSERLRQSALIVWIVVGAIALAYVVLQVADSVRVIWLPIAFAAGLVFILEPVVKTLERLRIPRVVGAILAFILLTALLIAVVALVFPTIREQAIELVEQLPDLYLGIVNWMRDVGQRFGLDVDELLSQQAIEDWLNDPTNQETVQNLLLGFGAGAGQLIRVGKPPSLLDSALGPFNSQTFLLACRN